MKLLLMVGLIAFGGFELAHSVTPGQILLSKGFLLGSWLLLMINASMSGFIPKPVKVYKYP